MDFAKRPATAGLDGIGVDGVRPYAVDHLGFRAAHFDVRMSNERVCQFHERFGATRAGETALDYLYRLGLEAIQASSRCYEKFLPDWVQVTFESEALT